MLNLEDLLNEFLGSRLGAGKWIPRDQLLTVDRDYQTFAADLAAEKLVEDHREVLGGLLLQRLESTPRPTTRRILRRHNSVEFLPDDDGSGASSSRFRALSMTSVRSGSMISQSSNSAIKSRSSCRVWMTRRPADVRVTTVRQRPCESDAVFRPKP